MARPESAEQAGDGAGGRCCEHGAVRTEGSAEIRQYGREALRMRADTENSLQSDSISSVRKEAAQAVVMPQDKTGVYR